MKRAITTAFAFLLLLGTAEAQSAVGTSGTTAKPSANAAAISADYRLAAGDKLRIEVYKDAQLSQALQVRPDGKVTLPLVGDITAAGRTSTELRDAIATALEEYIKQPTVTVIVTETTPQMRINRRNTADTCAPKIPRYVWTSSTTTYFSSEKNAAHLG